MVRGLKEREMCLPSTIQEYALLKAFKDKGSGALVGVTVRARMMEICRKEFQDETLAIYPRPLNKVVDDAFEGGAINGSEHGPVQITAWGEAALQKLETMFILPHLEAMEMSPQM